MIEMRIQGVTTDEKTQLQIAWLEGVGSNVMFPIVVGGLEALSISSSLDRHPLKRPNAHDLMETFMDHADARVSEVRITEIAEGRVKAEVFLETAGVATQLGARASDAVALAAKYEAPIFLSEQVLAKVGFVINKSSQGPLLEISTEDRPENGNEQGSGGDVVDAADDVAEVFGIPDLEARLAEAVAEEEYEEAARILREIRGTDAADQGMRG